MKRLKRNFVIFVLGIFLLSILSVGFVSAGLFSKNKISGKVVLKDDGWTPWLNRDDPAPTF